ncbi:hypothetical protein PGLA_00395 [Paenibacillus glacialis]|uniref:Uncharacterized protein n=1 Tax=Paenibacillus glacialis TaxID=494026 RepID=A0A168PFT3_9BACL|nr:hypothetical protein PGLA_00395 [Paenibacillus glacialis]
MANFLLQHEMVAIFMLFSSHFMFLPPRMVTAYVQLASNNTHMRIAKKSTESYFPCLIIYMKNLR